MENNQDKKLKFIGSYTLNEKGEVKFLGGRLVSLSEDQVVVPQLMKKPGYYFDRVVTVSSEQNK